MIDPLEWFHTVTRNNPDLNKNNFFLFMQAGEQSAAIQQISNGQHKIYHKLNVIIFLSFLFVLFSFKC